MPSAQARCGSSEGRAPCHLESSGPAGRTPSTVLVVSRNNPDESRTRRPRLQAAFCPKHASVQGCLQPPASAQPSTAVLPIQTNPLVGSVRAKCVPTPPNPHVEVWSSSTSECYYTSNTVFNRAKKVKMRSVWWTWTHVEERWCEETGRRWQFTSRGERPLRKPTLPTP